MAKASARGDVTISVRIDQELVDWIDAHAKANIRNRTQEIEYLMRLGISALKKSGEITSGPGVAASFGVDFEANLERRNRAIQHYSNDARSSAIQGSGCLHDQGGGETAEPDHG